MADYVESNIDFSFEVTSPNYTVNILNDDINVIKGQVAEYVVAVDFLNDFSTAGGISFSIDPATLPAGAVATFTPVPLKNPGGVLLKIDTANVAPGDYEIRLKAEEAATQPRYVSFFMVVTTIDTIRFFNWVYDQQTQTNNKEYITQIDRATQGSFPVSIEAVDAFGDIWDIMPSFHTGLRSPLTISSSNPAIVYVQQSAWGPEFHALAAGSANIVVTSSDGMQATLPVTVTIGETTPQVAISVFPSEVSSNYTGDISFSAISNYPLSQVGTSTQGFSNFSSNYSDNGSWGTGNLSYSSTFQLVNQEPDNFTVMFYASTSDGTTSITARTPLRITADPSLAALKGDVCILDDLWAENFTLEFYDLAGTKVFERDIFMMHQVDFQLAGIPAGDYKLRLVFGEDAAITQWYPNAGNFAGAQTVTFAAGGTVEDVYFFLSQGPTISFSGTVRGSDVNSPVDGTPVVGASVYSTDDWNVYTSTDGSGAFTLTGLPVNSPFDLEITATGFVTTYSQTFNTADDIAGLWPFVMFTSTELAGWPIAIMPAGTGFITGRVVDAANPSLPL
ncbi:MAG: carboxypeptidase-like regulatory domain-containing protein, partial [Syntrophales bacterium]|nr:carboxypeptidase-like regulatory domain-containing protein [Syntrophales bacterium]